MAYKSNPAEKGVTTIKFLNVTGEQKRRNFEQRNSVKSNRK